MVNQKNISTTFRTTSFPSIGLLVVDLNAIDNPKHPLNSHSSTAPLEIGSRVPLHHLPQFKLHIICCIGF
ncbi:hypothetical protein L1987_36479 [Smallanthus sonchifolius]|uniref:Uncharacterized protein n=1 Tax=Smallanthus sonchifolius TaxID=185202 RepID=A0ACB9HF26_9ASTR|nr:hypothetical protein L1987_36479 [Smallanthus sonchifolius]